MTAGKSQAKKAKETTPFVPGPSFAGKQKMKVLKVARGFGTCEADELQSSEDGMVREIP